MDFIWEDAGINLHFPAADCKEEIKLSVKVLTNVEENCIMPPGYRLMPMASAVYKISASAKLPAPVRVRMQHCAFVDQEEVSLVHIIAHCTSPYRFKLYNRGNFPVGESYSEIEMTQFSVLASIFKFARQICSHTLAIHVVSFRDSTAHIAVTKNIAAHITAIKEEYPNAKINSYPLSCPWLTTEIGFSEAEPDTQEGWKIQMEPMPSTLNTSSIWAYEKGCVIPKIELELEWTRENEQPREKKVHIRVEVWGGSTQSIPLSCKPPEQPQDQPSDQTQPLQQIPANENQPLLHGQRANQTQPNELQPNRSATPTLPLLQRLQTSGGVINVIERIAAKHHQLGIRLLKDNICSITNNIEAQYGPDPVRITEAILQRWLEGTGRTPQSWATLVTVLREIEHNLLAQEIEDNLPSTQ